MFGSLGLPELLFIFGLALLIFGPRKLPEIGRTIGRGLAEFRKASTDLKRSLNAEMIEEELRQSDPRKMMRDEPSDGTSEAASAESATSAESNPPDGGPAASEEAAEPHGSVSRGSALLAGTEAGVEAGSGDAVNGTVDE